MFFAPLVPQSVTLKALLINHPTAVRAVGDFNDWKPTGTPFTANADGTVWTLQLKLLPDVYSYVILENSDTLPTGDALSSASKELIVRPPEYKEKPGVRGDGSITQGVVRHRPDADVTRTGDRSFQLILRTRKSDVESASVTVIQSGHDQKSYAMVFDRSNELFDFYKVNVVVDPDIPFEYRFMLNDGEGGRAFDTRGLGQGSFGGGEPFKVDPQKFELKKP